jgi:hypothetical protein
VSPANRELAPLKDFGEYGLRAVVGALLDGEVADALGDLLGALVRTASAHPYTVAGHLRAIVADLRRVAEELEAMAGWPERYDVPEVADQQLCEQAGASARAVYELIGRIELPRGEA